MKKTIFIILLIALSLQKKHKRTHRKEKNYIEYQQPSNQGYAQYSSPNPMQQDLSQATQQEYNVNQYNGQAQQSNNPQYDSTNQINTNTNIYNTDNNQQIQSSDRSQYLSNEQQVPYQNQNDYPSIISNPNYVSHPNYVNMPANVASVQTIPTAVYQTTTPLAPIIRRGPPPGSRFNSKHFDSVYVKGNDPHPYYNPTQGYDIVRTVQPPVIYARFQKKHPLKHKIKS